MIPSYSIPVAVALYFAVKALYNRLFHPLRHIPGPALAAVSPLWLSFHDLQFCQAHAVHEAFKKYGPVVRVGPNKVVFLDVPSIRPVYVSRLPKSSFYKALITNENDHAMTCLDHQSHSKRRRAFSPHYMPSHLATFQPEIHEYVRQYLSKLYAHDGGVLNSITLHKRLLVDILFRVTYGQEIRSLEQWDFKNNAHDPVADIVEAIELFPIRGVLRSAFPAAIWPYLSAIPSKAWKAVVNSDAIVAAYVTNARDKAVAANPDLVKPEANELPDMKVSLLQRLLRQSTTAKEYDRLSQEDVISEAMGHTIAGVDTSSTTLSYIFYTLANRPDILAKLRAEIDPLITDDVQDSRIPHAKATFPDISVLNKLPYLTAFVKESLRLYGSGPSLLERVVPNSLDEQLDIAGFRIPAGTIIATQAWSTHRQEDVFPSPDEFKPERWFDETEAMTISMMPFGTGTRICGGMNLAHIVIRIVITALIRNFDIVVPAETTPASMECRFAFVLLPAGRRINLQFVPRKEEH